jgi:hypothetical protein
MRAKPTSEVLSMRHEIQTPSSPLKTHKFLLVICGLTILCLSHTALAQSGRRPKGNPSAATAPPANAEAKAGAEINPSTVKPPVPISSVIVVGDLIQSGSSYSNYVDEAVDACVDELKKLQAIEPKGSGSRKRTAAIERAKNETDAYVLLMEIKLEDRVRTDRGVYVEEYITCVDYYVFMPQTAKILTQGRVFPGTQDINAGGAVLRLPTRNRRPHVTRELREIGRQVANRVRNKFP